MNYWIREIAGWLLVALGLYIFFICITLLTDQRRSWLLESGPTTLIGIIVFRGGIHILKIGVAARVCAEAQTAVAAQEMAPRAARLQAPGRTK